MDDDNDFEFRTRNLPCGALPELEPSAGAGARSQSEVKANITLEIMENSQIEM